MKNSLFLLIIACLAISCSQTQKTTDESASDKLPTYRYETFKITSSKTADLGDGIDTAYFEATYPEFSDEQINQYVQQNIVLDSGETSLEQMGREFIKDYEEFYDQAEFKRIWYQNKADSVAVQTKSYIGFRH